MVKNYSFLKHVWKIKFSTLMANFMFMFLAIMWKI